MGSQQAIFAHVATLVLGAEEKHSRDLTEEEALKELKNEANLEEAKKFRIKNAVVNKSDKENPKLYSIWSTSPEDLVKYGVGLELYFLFLKQMAVLFFIAACFSIYPAYTNSTGSIIHDDESQSGSRYTLANTWWFKRDHDEFLDNVIGNKTCLPWSAINCNSSDINYHNASEWQSETLDDINENYKEIWIIDAIYSWIFLLGIIVILIINKIKIHHNTLGQSRVSDYSIEVAGFPNENIDKEEIKNHFIDFGEIVDVYIGRSYGDLLYFYKERATVLKEIRTQKIFLEDDPEIESDNKKLKKLKGKLSKLNENIKNLSTDQLHNEFPVHRAYIIFNTKESRAQALTKYRKGFFGWRHNRSAKLKFREKYQLKVYPGSEPSDILWENLELKRFERRKRITLSIIITVLMMGASVGLIFLMRRGSEHVDDAFKCLKINEEISKLSIDEITQYGPDSTERACWCSQHPATEWTKEPAIRSICLHYIYNRLSSAAVNFSICFGIVVTNFILRLFLTTLSEFERRQSYNIRQTHTMLKIFVAMLFNTILAPILVHAKYGSYEESKVLVENQFHDFTKMWYLRVGSMFFIMMCISIVSPHFIFNFLVNYMRGLWMRMSGYKLYRSQYQMHNAFIGPIFVITTRTSMILTVIFTCFIFSGGIPLLNIIGFSALFVIYWTDKFLILRHYRRPPEYNHHIYSSAIKAMPLCVFFHSCVSLYAYGCPNVFPKGFVVKTYESESESFPYLDYKEQDLLDRITMDHGKVFLIIAVVSFILFLLFEFSEKITRHVKRILLLRDHEETDNFNDIEEEMKNYTLTRYDLELNPEYSHLIELMNQDVEERRSLSSKGNSTERMRMLKAGITSSSEEESWRFNTEGNAIRTSPTSLMFSGPNFQAPTSQSKPPSINLNFDYDIELNDKDVTSSSPNKRAANFEVQNTSQKSISSGSSEDSNSGICE